MTATYAVARSAISGEMRPLNILRDLPAIADLIEICFAATMDAEGRSYVDQMRRNGRDSSFIGWASKVIDSTSLPLSGFVWDDGGKIVGNVSLIPFFKNGRKIYLIANVATHPDYRRRGIARALTDAAMARAIEKQAASIWLHVRQENSGAVSLYRQLGFQERAARTSWFASPGSALPAQGHGRIEIHPRAAQDWPVQSQWLEKAYPKDLNWYSQQNWQVFQPGLLPGMYRFFADISTQQWSAYNGNALLGVISCQHLYGRPDSFWAAFPADPTAEAVTGLLSYTRRILANSRGAAMEYPAGMADEAIHAAGFSPLRTLVWMEAPGASK